VELAHRDGDRTTSYRSVLDQLGQQQLVSRDTLHGRDHQLTERSHESKLDALTPFLERHSRGTQSLHGIGRHLIVVHELGVDLQHGSESLKDRSDEYHVLGIVGALGKLGVELLEQDMVAVSNGRHVREHHLHLALGDDAAAAQPTARALGCELDAWLIEVLVQRVEARDVALF